MGKSPGLSIAVALLCLLVSAAGWEAPTASAKARGAPPCKPTLRPTLSTVSHLGRLRLRRTQADSEGQQRR